MCLICWPGSHTGIPKHAFFYKIHPIFTNCYTTCIVTDMKSNKVQLNVRVSPELLAYLKQKAPSNVSHYVEEILRREMLNDVTDDVVARLAKALCTDPNFIIQYAMAKKRVPASAYCPCIRQDCEKLHRGEL